MASHIFHVFSRCSLDRWKASRVVLGALRTERKCSSTDSTGSYVNDKKPEVNNQRRKQLIIGNIEGQEEEKHSPEDEEEELKKKILNASLPFVNSHGWSTMAITAGAESLGYPSVIHGMFPGGGFDLVQHFYITSNNKLAEVLKEDEEALQSDVNLKRSEREIIENAVEKRLRMIIPYIEKWPQALALRSFPQHSPTSIASLLMLVDDICYYAGDRSVDMGWYGKRLGLAGVYKLTELYMVQDSTEDRYMTWQFLHRRLDELFHFHNLIKTSDNTLKLSKDFGAAAFTAARNILGMGWNR